MVSLRLEIYALPFQQPPHGFGTAAFAFTAGE